MAKIFQLSFPQSLGVFDEYEDAQRAVDRLADNDFPVGEVLIVGTDLKQVERVTGKLSWGTVLLRGAVGGAWMGLLVGLLLGLFAAEGRWLGLTVAAVGFGALWGAVFSAVSYGATRGERDFASVKAVIPSRYEVLVEHKHLARGQELLRDLQPPQV